MNIEIKKTTKPVKYLEAIKFLEERLQEINNGKKEDLIWILEHDEIYTAGTSYKEEEILNKDIELTKTNRGGKITWHGPGQLICYFVIDLKKRKKDIRKFITFIEKTIIESLSEFDIQTFGDPKNIGIWTIHNNKVSKVAAIGVRVSKWIAYHGFAINIDNNLSNYKNIIPCGITDKGVINLKEISDQDYKKLGEVVIKKFSKNLKDLVS
jgi:lipoyl(octanoyl) transferase